MAPFDAENVASSCPSFTRPRILLVDDDESLLDALALVLEQNDFAVSSASNVNQALALIASNPFDVLVSDLHMPEYGDGLTVVSAMRHANPAAVTVIFSAYPEMKRAAQEILKQTDAVVVKPLGVDNLIHVIRERLHQGPGASPRKIESVADILERCIESTVEEWLRMVAAEPQILCVPLDEHDRSAHVAELLREVVARLRAPIPLGPRDHASAAAAEHGLLRRQQGYTAAMLVEESRLLQASIFQTLHENFGKIDFSLVLVDVMAIADECEWQLAQQMSSFVSDANAEAWNPPNSIHRQVA
ncbi:MAG TPA: response regulator [Acidobacteriaceae bacterium]|jgi:DNA-binding response OmpR family regulator